MCCRVLFLGILLLALLSSCARDRDNPLDPQYRLSDEDTFGLSARLTNLGVELSWKQVNHPVFRGYRIYRAGEPFAGWSLVDSVNKYQHFYTDNNIDSDGIYYYCITISGPDNAESRQSDSVAVAVSGLDQWRPMGDIELTWRAAALISHNGDLMAGFVNRSAALDSYIARFNGESWSTVAFTNDFVSVLGIFRNNLIAGGYFTLIDDVAVSNIASWNNNVWLSMNSGVYDDFFDCVWTLAVYDEKLIVGGSFSRAGSTIVSNIASWNDTSWSTLYYGLDDYVKTLNVFRGDLIAGGQFINSGAIWDLNHIARWDGLYWHKLGTGMNDGVYALAVYNDNLIAGGTFTMAGGTNANYIARWDGNSWWPLGSGMDSAVVALTVYNDELIAAGRFVTAGDSSANRIARWDGYTWRPLGTGMNNVVYELTVFEDRLVAAGLFTTAGGIQANSIAAWFDFTSADQ